MLLEAAARPGDEAPYQIALDTSSFPWILDTRPMMAQIARDIAAGRSARIVSHCFHDTIALMIDVACRNVREKIGMDKVCLSGGAFQNFTVLSRAVSLLRRSGFQVFLHSRVPPNDGGLSLGQAVIAAASLERMEPDVSRNPG